MWFLLCLFETNKKIKSNQIPMLWPVCMHYILWLSRQMPLLALSKWRMHFMRAAWAILPPYAKRERKKYKGKQIMLERIYPKDISWLAQAALGPSSGHHSNRLSKSGHCQPRSITTTNPIDASLECVGLFLGETGGHLHSCSTGGECTVWVLPSLCSSGECDLHEKCANLAPQKNGKVCEM